MKSIRIFNDGELETEFLGVDICSRTAEYCPYGRATETLEFFFDKHIDHHPKKVWTGKFICVTNFKNKLVFTPGKVYQATKDLVYDGTMCPFSRGTSDDKCVTFSAGSFEELQKDFLKYDIDIIEYKGEASTGRFLYVNIK